MQRFQWVAIILSALLLHNAVAQEYFFCAPKLSYYPKVNECPEPWRLVDIYPNCPVEIVGCLVAADENRKQKNADKILKEAAEKARLETEARQKAESERLKKQLRVDTMNGLRHMTVDDYDLDKKNLSPKVGLVISGYYSRLGGMEQLSKFPPLAEFANQPAINLITENAPRKARAIFQKCSLSSYGCRLTLTGHPDRCTINFLGNAVHSDICLIVDGVRD